MPKIALYFFLFLSSFSFAQEYNHVDKKVKNYPCFYSIEQLSYRIQNDFSLEVERVRAAFIWLTNNLSYGKTLDELFKPKLTIVYYSDKGRERQLKKTLDEKANYAFEHRRGVCFDYSILLKKLCDNFGIESIIVKGIVKEDIKNITGEKVYKNHTWNAIKLKDTWILMDPTWASGYWDDSDQIFVKSFNPHYFNTNPRELIKNHFPADTKWQLLEETISLNEFYEAPIFLSGYFDNKIVVSNQTSGLLKQSENLEFVFSFEEFPLNTQLNYSIDSKDVTGKIRKMNLRKVSNRFISKLRLNNALINGENLTLYIDKSPILRFKINP